MYTVFPVFDDVIKYFRIFRYESTIVGQFYGHAHDDEFEIFYDPASNFTRPTSMAYVGPSVVGASSGNSGYKVYTIDGNYTGTTSVSAAIDGNYTGATSVSAAIDGSYTGTTSVSAAIYCTANTPARRH